MTNKITYNTVKVKLINYQSWREKMTVKISLWEAYLIETLRSNGMPTVELIDHLKQENKQALTAFDDTFDYSELVDIYKEDPNRIEQAINLGYQVKFVTQPGVKRLLQLKFGFEEGKDFNLENNIFVNLRLTEEQLTIFKQILSPNWEIVATGDGTYHIRLVTMTN